MKNRDDRKSGSNMSSSAMATMDGMNMSARTPVDTLPQALSPKYSIGSKVKILATHMQGMKGASGTVTGAFDCIAYAVDVSATNGMQAKDHKWIIAEETQNGKGKVYHQGDTVSLSQGHVAGMFGEGSKATVVEVHPAPVYMISFTPTNGGEPVKDHQWVVEDELQSL